MSRFSLMARYLKINKCPQVVVAQQQQNCLYDLVWSLGAKKLTDTSKYF